MKELKELLHLNSTNTLNVFFAKSAQEELAGAATWPWAKEALTHQGESQVPLDSLKRLLTHGLTVKYWYNNTLKRISISVPIFWRLIVNN